MAKDTSDGRRSAPLRILVAIKRPWDHPDMHEVAVGPATTARCVVTQLGLRERLLVKLGREVIVLPEDVPLIDIPCVYDGIRLFAL